MSATHSDPGGELRAAIRGIQNVHINSYVPNLRYELIGLK